ncbi:MAG: D-alanyl-D-alanine carboxypeptidase family protein [Pseudomonadota bacterium]
MRPVASSQAFGKALTRIAAAAVILGVSISPALAERQNKYASIVVDVDSAEILHARYADAARFPASLTKVMTLYMVFDALEAGDLMLSDELTVSKTAAAQQPSKLALRPGSKITVEAAINALITKSANDIAVVIAERLGGTESRFAALMTAKARALGLEDTRFTNASGLPDANQTSTARDLAKLAETILLNHADYYDYFATQDFVYRGAHYENHNALLGEVRGVDGIKTGYTRASGFNLMASAERDGRRVIAIMLGGATSKSRNKHVTDLLEAAFDVLEAKAQREAPPLRARIAFNEIQNMSTDELNAAQYREIAEQGSAQN